MSVGETWWHGHWIRTNRCTVILMMCLASVTSQDTHFYKVTSVFIIHHCVRNFWWNYTVTIVSLKPSTFGLNWEHFNVPIFLSLQHSISVLMCSVVIHFGKAHDTGAFKANSTGTRYHHRFSQNWSNVPQRERGTLGRESHLRCYSLMIRVAEDVVLVHVLCWKWRCVTHPLTQGRGVDSRLVTVLLKLALCC